MAKRNMCIECAWCDLKVDFENGSNYFCLKRKEVLPAALLDRKACGDFVSPTCGAHWGP